MIEEEWLYIPSNLTVNPTVFSENKNISMHNDKTRIKQNKVILVLTSLEFLIFIT